MISINLKEGILQLSKRRLGVFVEKSTFPGINQYDEVVEINNVRADIYDKTTIQRQLSELSICNLLILPNNEQQLIQMSLKANNIYVKKPTLSESTKIQKSTHSLIQVLKFIFE